ncbi:Rv1733c family protein [Mycolicibacterium parafortuitum]|uniref:Putative membrane protein n=1 Tax=Mycolicibacterium parafortuitum TaxID=39692 RepID=A0A375YMX9_MYCPF|nr:hypothetical protein [Mycolicibacterium parafortuitum]ORB28626.1 hypothetical protein BST38_19480 [Mycolicibacterium parafortuitum]SRX82505.1 putative membrane protein [Mycolicibacterium parafortuitum]
MQTATLPLMVWLRRLMLPHPLVRAADRIESAAILVIAVLALLAVPVAGAVGTAQYDHLRHTFAADREALHEVRASAVSDSRTDPGGYQTSYRTDVQWVFGGELHRAEIVTPGMSGGEEMVLQVDDEGHPAGPVPSDQDAAVEAVMTAVLVWSAVVGVALAVGVMVRIRLNLTRFAAWDRELTDLVGDGGHQSNGPS